MPFEAVKGSTGTGAGLPMFHGARWRWVVTAVLRILYLYPRKESWYPLNRRQDEAPGPVWTGVERRKYLALTGV
jgi:hypothetical protein